jgi:hypothetical protein
VRIGAPFSVAASLRYAQEVLSRPPALPYLRRPEPRGELVARFAVPTELCPPGNATRHGKGFKLGDIKETLWSMLAIQNRGPRRLPPLEGRPQVLCMRLSAVESDPYCDWAKFPVDMLCAPTLRIRNHRLNLIAGDRLKEADTWQWWEPSPKARECVYIEVRTGEP